METTRTTYNQRDALLKRPGVFPTSAGTTYTGSLDLGDIGVRGVRIDPFELTVEVPALTAAQLPSGTSLAYSLQFSDTEDFSTGVDNWTPGVAWSQVGSAAGSAALAARFRATTAAKRYVRAKCERTGTSGDLTGVNFVLDFVT